MIAYDLTGRTIVVTAGTPHENIDGIRHYANHERLESHGFSAAKKLKERGATVIIVTPDNELVPPEGCEVVKTLPNGNKIASGEDVMNAAEAVIASRQCDAALCLASVSSIKAAAISDHKIKAKNKPGEPAKWTVAKNVNIEQQARTWHIPVIGYDSWQQTFSTPSLPGWLSSAEIWNQGEKNWPTSLQTGVASKDLPEWLVTPPKPEETSYTLKLKKPKDNGDEEEEKLEITEKSLNLSPEHLKNLEGKTIILTSGPTEEQLTTTGDVITNFSTGRQGYEIANILAAAGAKVKYIVGRTNFPDPDNKNVETIHVTSAKSMLKEVLEAAKSVDHADAYIGVAAVADFGCKNPIDTRCEEKETIEMVLDQNPDIVETMAKHETHRPVLVISFAAENDKSNLILYALGKLRRKEPNMVCANYVDPKDSAQNQIFFVMPTGETNRYKIVRTELMPKAQAGLAVAAQIASMTPKASRTEATPGLKATSITHG